MIAGSIAIAGFSLFLVPYLVNVVSADPPGFVRRYGWLLLGVALALVLITGRYVRGRNVDTDDERIQISEIDSLNGDALARVEQLAREELATSIGSATRISLRLLRAPNAVRSIPALREHAQDVSAPRSCAPESFEVEYEKAHRQILLLGEPGLGKTTLLVELALSLVEKSRNSPKLILPAVVNLASWSNEYDTLDDWLVEEVSLRYTFPRDFVRRKLARQEIALLLDGLDEVTEERREACLGAINEYRSRLGFTPIVVATRTTEYEALADRLALYSAVEIQRPTLAEADDYLRKLAGPAAESVRAVPHRDKKWWMFVRSPLVS